jgi:hypothetical protein
MNKENKANLLSIVVTEPTRESKQQDHRNIPGFIPSPPASPSRTLHLPPSPHGRGRNPGSNISSQQQDALAIRTSSLQASGLLPDSHSLQREKTKDMFGKETSKVVAGLTPPATPRSPGANRHWDHPVATGDSDKIPLLGKGSSKDKNKKDKNKCIAL